MSFESLGLKDPFPDDNSSLVNDKVIQNGKITMESEVYPAGRFLNGSPKCIYIPSK